MRMRGYMQRARTPGASGPRRRSRRAGKLYALAAAAAFLPACLPAASTTEPDLAGRRIDRLILSADVVVEGEVASGGTFDALFHVTEIYAGECPEYIELFNTNKHPWNTTYHAWRTGDRYILLLAGDGARYTLLQPGVGAYRLGNGKVITSVSEPPLRYPVAEDDFRAGVRAVCDLYSGKRVRRQALERFHEMLGGGDASQRHFAAEMLGNLFDATAAGILVVAAESRNPKLRQAAVELEALL